MPYAAKKPCREKNCRALVDVSGYCKAHKKPAWLQKNPRTTTERGYGAAWRKKRLPIIRRDKGLCQLCLRDGRLIEFSAVDHIIPKSKGGSDDPENLQCICSECHKKKTAQDKMR